MQLAQQTKEQCLRSLKYGSSIGIIWNNDPQTSLFSTFSWRHRHQWLWWTPTPECTYGAKLTILGKYWHYMNKPALLYVCQANCRSQLCLSFISIAFHWAQKHIGQSWPVNEDKHAIQNFWYHSRFPYDYDYENADGEENDKYHSDVRSTDLSGVRTHFEIDTNCVWTSSLGHISFPDKLSDIIKGN